MRVRCRGQAERVWCQVAARRRVVIPVLIVVQAGFRVGVLAGEAERGLGAARVPHGGAPQGVPLGARQCAVGGGQLGRGADEVGDDRVEPLVDLLLRGFAQLARGRVLGLRQRGEAAGPVVPGDDLMLARLCGRRGLLGQDGAVPGEVGLLGDVPVGGEPLLGDPAPERVVTVTPGGVVRGGDGGQPAVGVPVVVPRVRLAGDPDDLPLDDAALAVVPVADVPGPRDQRPRDLARPLRVVAGPGPGRAGHGPGPAG